MSSPLYQQQQAFEQSMQSRFGQPLPDPSGLGQVALMQQTPEFQQYMQQRQDLDRQLQAYSQTAPMYKQLMDVQGQMQAIASPYGGPDGVGQPGFAQQYMQQLASVPQSIEQQQALQQFQQTQQQLNNAMQSVPDFAQPYVQGLQQIPSPNAMQGQPNFAQPYVQGLGAMAASRAAPRSNPMTGLGAFSANPSIAAANPFAGLGVTAGAQQARQNVQPPYNPGLDDSRMGDNFGRQPPYNPTMSDDFIGSQRPAANFGQTVGQLFGMGQTLGQPQTQQSPYAQQQSSNLMQQPQNPNLMQNAGQVGQGVYGSFVGQQQQPQPVTQQPGQQQQQNPAQTMQGTVAPPMQAGFNFFDQGPTQSQGQNNTGGGTTGGGLF